MASGGDPHHIPYSEENEQKVISIMEEQAQSAKVKPLRRIDKILSISQPLILPIAIVNFIYYGGIFDAIMIGIIGTSVIIYPTRCLIHVIKKRDVGKLHFFVNCKDELNDKIKTNENMLLNVSKKTVNQIKQADANKPPLSINDIENYSLKDLRTMKDNLDRIKSFGFNENKSVLENQGNCYKKTVNSKK